MPEIYSDLNAITPDRKTILRDAEAIFASLTNLFSTDPYERLHRPDYTANLSDLLFEPLHDDVAIQIKSRALNAIRIFEPRINVIPSESFVRINEQEDGYDVFLTFTLVGVDIEKQTFRAIVLREN